MIKILSLDKAINICHHHIIATEIQDVIDIYWVFREPVSCLTVFVEVLKCVMPSSVVFNLIALI